MAQRNSNNTQNSGNGTGSGVQAAQGTQTTEDQFEAGNNYVIEASAGTGKTYTIVEILKKLLAPENNVRLDQILVVTYTEKAAGELKDRIRKMRDESEAKINLSSDEIDRAMIGTIHSFCQKTLEEFCISSGKPSGLAVIDEGDCREFVKKYMREGNLFSSIVDFKKPENSFFEDNFLKKTVELIEKYYLDGSFREDADIIKLDPVEKYLADKVKPGTGSIQELLHPDVDILSGSSDQAIGKLAADLKQAEGSGSIQTVLDVWNNKPEIVPQKDSPEEKALFHLGDVLAHSKNYDLKTEELLAVAYAKELYQKWTEEKAKHAQQTFNDMIRNVREEVMQPNSLLKEKLKKKYKYAIIDEFQDTNRKQWDIFREVFLDSAHNLIVVGDPKQSIYAFQGADLEVYTDAKQEIINKHNGILHELDTNYRSSDDMIESINNFFDNPKVEKEDALPSFSRSNIPDQPQCWAMYEGKPVKALWIAPQGADFPDIVCQKIIECCKPDPNDLQHTRLRFFELKKDSENPDKPEKIDDSDATFGDFAILTRVRSEMVSFTRALQAYGIPYIQYKDNDLLSGQECAQWTALLEAIDAPDFTGDNRALFKKAMFTPFFGHSVLDLKDSSFDGDSRIELSSFARWKPFVAEKNWEALFESIMEETRIEGRLGTPQDLRSLCILRQIGEHCIDYLSKGKTLTQLVKYLKKHLKDAASSDDEETAEENATIVARGTDFKCVKVMTIHASKGLEFPVVISGTGKNNPKNSADIYSCHDRYNRSIVSFNKPDEFSDEMCEEWKRLIYVNYTRAKYILMLPVYGKIRTNKFKFIDRNITAYTSQYPNDFLPLCKDVNITPDALKQETAGILASYRSSVSTGISKDDQKANAKELKADNYAHVSYKHAYSSLSDEKQEAGFMTDERLLPESDEQEEGEAAETRNLSRFDQKGVQVFCDYHNDKISLEFTKEFPEDFPKGKNLGNALHRIFEIIDYQNEDTQNSAPDTVLVSQAQFEQSFKENDIACKTEWKDYIDKMAGNVLSARLPEIHGGIGTGNSFHLKDLSFKDRLNEKEFNFNLENESFRNYFNGFIDLIIRRKDEITGNEYFSILDWKSDRQKTYSDEKKLKRRVDRHYSIQRVLYAYTLIKWLTQIYQKKDADITEETVFRDHFGGVYYVFLRGCNEETGNGIYAQTWRTYDDLKRAYDEIVSEKIPGRKKGKAEKDPDREQAGKDEQKKGEA